MHDSWLTMLSSWCQLNVWQLTYHRPGWTYGASWRPDSWPPAAEPPTQRAYCPDLFLCNIKEESDRSERKGWWVDVLECQTSQLSTRIIWRKVFGKNIHFGRVVVWFGVNRKIFHFSELSFLLSVRSSTSPFLQICSAARNWINYSP